MNNESYNIKCKGCNKSFTTKKATQKFHSKECKFNYNSMISKVIIDRYLIENNIKKCCKKCGESDEIVLDFHHIDPTTKSHTISKLKSMGKESKLIKELAKCIILCSNCHRKFHRDERSSSITIKEWIK